MIFMNFLKRHFSPPITPPITKLKLKDLQCRKEENYNGYQRRMFYKLICEHEGKCSFIDYCPETGQIGFLVVDRAHQRRGLATQLVIEACKEMTVEEAWLFGSWENPFYINSFGKAFRKRSPADNSITGDGWRIKVSDVLAFENK
jgi:hypothetical protein